MANFWKDKEPCWILLGCSKYVYPECAAYLDQEKPCWENASTHCKNLLKLKWECENCRVFKICNP